VYRAEGRGDWRRASHSLASCAIRAIVAVDAQTLVVAVENAPAQQSFDGGATWSEAAEAPEPIGLEVATVNGRSSLAYPRLGGATAYARLAGKPAVLLGAGAGGMALFWSEDDGIHWRPAGIADGDVGNVTALLPAPERRDSAWAGTSTGALLRSDDRGRGWRVVAREPAAILCLAAALH
jgi:hypothetical protein